MRRRPFLQWITYIAFSVTHDNIFWCLSTGSSTVRGSSLYSTSTITTTLPRLRALRDVRLTLFLLALLVALLLILLLLLQRPLQVLPVCTTTSPAVAARLRRASIVGATEVVDGTATVDVDDWCGRRRGAGGRGGRVATLAFVVSATSRAGRSVGHRGVYIVLMSGDDIRRRGGMRRGVGMGRIRKWARKICWPIERDHIHLNQISHAVTSIHHAGSSSKIHLD